jgi:hypothetical protein
MPFNNFEADFTQSDAFFCIPDDAVDLLEHHGREATLGEKYRSILQKVRTQHPQIQYRDFAFHSQTKGLQYENVKRLLEMLETEFSSTQYVLCCQYVGLNLILTELLQILLDVWWTSPVQAEWGVSNKLHVSFINMSLPKRILLTNAHTCRDCLDRTNVVQVLTLN